MEKEAAILSDGMGSGERALQESGMLVEMPEELLSRISCGNCTFHDQYGSCYGTEEVRFSRLI